MIQQTLQTFANPLYRVIVGTATALGALHIVMFAHWGPGVTIPEINWLVPVINSFLALAAFTIAVLSLGRFRALGVASSYWAGSGFATISFGFFFWLLAWPWLLPRAQPILGHTLSAAVYIAESGFSIFGFCLLGAAQFSRPSGLDLSGRRCLVSVAGWGALMTAVSILILLFDQSLPILVRPDGTISLFLKLWTLALLFLFAAGAVVSSYHYRKTGDTLVGYTAFLQIAVSFFFLAGAVTGNRHSLLFSLDRLLLFIGFMVVLFGLLSDYVGLLRREREKTIQLQARSTELLTILENIPQPVFVTDLNGLPLFASAGAQAFSPLGDLKPMLEQVARGEILNQIEVLLKPNNRWLLVSGRPLEVHAGKHLGGLLVATDITERKLYETRILDLNCRLDQHVLQLETALREKSLLLKEVQHRVKNNLQVIASITSLQARQVGTGPAYQAMLTLIDRVRSMALVHEGLCFSGMLAQIDFAIYVRDLAKQLIKSCAVDPDTIAIHFDIDAQLSLDQAAPCGLILNELLSNSLKHAFPGSAVGQIWIRCRAADGEFALECRDNGVGMPAGFSLANASSLGLQVATDLALQLGGSLEWVNDGGSVFRLRFANYDKPQPLSSFASTSSMHT